MIRRLFLAFVLLGSGGCVKQAGTDLVAGALSEENNRLATEFLADPAFREAVNDLGQELLRGALDGLTDEQRATLVYQRTSAFVEKLVPLLTHAIDAELSPSLQRALRDSAAAAVQGFVGPKARANATSLVDALARTLAATLAQGLRDEVGPAARDALLDDVGPALGSAVRDEIGPALGAALRDDVLPDLQVEMDRQRTALVADLARTLDDGKDALRVALAGAILVLVLLLAAVFGIERARRRRDRSLALIAETIKEFEEDERIQALVDAIRERGKGDEGGADLQEFLKQHREWKVVRRHRG